MFVFGSSSVCLHNELGRNPCDIDLLCSREEFKNFHNWCKSNFTIRFFELKESGATLFLKRYNESSIVEIVFDGEGRFAESNKMIQQLGFPEYCQLVILGENYGNVANITLAGYYWQKMSHRFLKNSKHFNKTRNDILKLRENAKAIVENPTFEYEKYKEFYEQRVKETYGYKHPNLNQKKSTFFTDEVGYIYDHDDIHEAVKMLDKPAYRYYIEPGQEVKCSKELFDSIPYIVKLYGVLEESYVLALERAVIPLNVSADKAFEIALEKVCTSITSGWFREFAWENYDEVKKLYHDSYVNKFNNALVAGKVRGFRED